jgi:hypothetical protein
MPIKIIRSISTLEVGIANLTYNTCWPELKMVQWVWSRHTDRGEPARMELLAHVAPGLMAETAPLGSAEIPRGVPDPQARAAASPRLIYPAGS